MNELMRGIYYKLFDLVTGQLIKPHQAIERAEESKTQAKTNSQIRNPFTCQSSPGACSNSAH